MAKEKGIATVIKLGTEVTDIKDLADNVKVAVTLEDGNVFQFDKLVICTGHSWPKALEGKVQGYYDSPYPPSKLARKFNHPVAIKGASLTAIDAIRTIARHNGAFTEKKMAYSATRLLRIAPILKW